MTKTPVSIRAEVEQAHAAHQHLEPLLSRTMQAPAGPNGGDGGKEIDAALASMRETMDALQARLEGVPVLDEASRAALDALSYDELESVDMWTKLSLAPVLNANGLAHRTVCPECHVDDFVHVEGCPNEA